MGLTVFLHDENEKILFTADISHKHKLMAVTAGIKNVLWNPHEYCDEDVVHAEDIVSKLREGVIFLATNKKTIEALNPSQGSWVVLLLFCTSYLQACKDFPNATIRVSR